MSEFQKNCELVQFLGVKEKVKDSAVSTIEMLKKTNIKLWLASGDKLEKVLPIAYSCNLLSAEIAKVQFNNPS